MHAGNESFQLEATEMVRRELPGDPEDGDDPRSGRLLEPTQRGPDSTAEQAKSPVFLEQLVSVELRLVARDVEARAACLLAFVHEPAVDQDFQVVRRRS